MRWNLPPLNAVRSFEAAGRNLSFTLAARELNVTPGAVSRQIKLLEEFVGTRLFDRAHREVKLTDSGKQYLEELTDTFSRLNSATARFTDCRCDQTLRVSSSVTITLKWLIPRLISFHAANPASQIQLNISLKPPNFRTDDVDIAIRMGSGTWANSVSYFLMPSDLVPVCSPSLQKSLPLNTIGDLKHHTLLHSTVRPRNWPTWLKSVAAQNLEDSHGVYFENSGLALQAAVGGMGIAIGQTQLIAEDLAAGRLIMPFSHVAREEDAFYILYPESVGRNRRILQKFRDWLLSEAGSSLSHEKRRRVANR